MTRMVVDVGTVKQHIKPKADSTLNNMRKRDLIEYIRSLEHNYNVAVSFNENQARYIETLNIVPRPTAAWKDWWPSIIQVLSGEKMLHQCTACTAKYSDVEGFRYCPHCGAFMDEIEVSM